MLGVGVIGFGTIGTGVVRLLREHAGGLGTRVGVPLRLVRVADLDTRSKRGIKLARGVLIRDAHRLIADPAVDIVVELVGGIEPARSFILEAMRAGKSVVTANKALLSVHGSELAAAAEKNGVAFGFEAAVGGGIPIVRTLRESLVGDRNQEVYGIVNGTANYILSEMSAGAGEFAEVLARAQEMGLAEADPSYDVDGIDSLHKLVILVALAFGKKIRPDSVHVEGIRKIDAADIAYAEEFGYAIRLLAVARDTAAGVEARVHPSMVPRSHLLANVSGAFNAICIRGKALGTSIYYGQGAGMMPTATAVLADIMEAAGAMRDDSANRVLPYGQPVDRLRPAPVVPMGRTEHEYYIRFRVADRPGVLARISRILGSAGISIATVAQHEASRRGSVPVVIRTYRAGEAAMRRALARIASLKDSRAQPVVIRVEEALGRQA
ncbi:MAG: homoserine dehydrogenase [Deltaproteobacteria bacterium]